MIKITITVDDDTLVALRKESVDRNVDPDKDTLTDDGRSPQGERG